MGLCNLLAEQRFDIDLFVFDLESKHFMRVVDVLMNERVLKHRACAQTQKQVPSHIVGQIRHNYGTTTGFLYSSAVDLQEVEVAIDVDLAVLVLHNRCGRQDLAVF